MKCVDCVYFLNCEYADKNKKECNNYKTRYMQLVSKDGEIFKFKEINNK